MALDREPLVRGVTVLGHARSGSVKPTLIVTCQSVIFAFFNAILRGVSMTSNQCMLRMVFAGLGDRVADRVVARLRRTSR